MRDDVEHRVELFDTALRRAGRVAMIACPRMPAMPRDSRPSGLHQPHRLGQGPAPRARSPPVCLRASGHEVRSRCRRSTRSGRRSRRPSRRRTSATMSAPSAVTRCSTTSKPAAVSWSTSAAPLRSSRAPWTTPSLTVNTFACSGASDPWSAHADRRYRTSTMPSVSASWGSTRHPWPIRPPGSGRRLAVVDLEALGDRMIDRLGGRQRADAVDQAATGSDQRSAADVSRRR